MYLKLILQESSFSSSICRLEDQIADIFTKPFELKIDVFIKLRDLFGHEGCSKLELREDVGY